MTIEPRNLADIALFADELPAAVWVGRAPGGEVVYVNKAFGHILRMAEPPAVGRGNYVEPYGVFTRDGAPYPEKDMPFERALAARTTVEIDDIVIHRGDGTRCNLRVYAKPIFDERGAVTHVLEVFTDITREVAAERARAEGEARLRHGQRMESIGNLAGGIAHDFNNLLAAIKIMASQLRITELDPARQRTLRDIDQVVESGVKLTTALLGFARRGRAPSARVALNDVVAPIAELCRRTFDKRIDVVLDLAATGAVVGDPGQLEQLVMNLALNARDAMPGGGTVTLRTYDVPAGSDAAAPERTAPGPRVALEVQDTGTGIDPAIRERIFEPYFTTKTSGAVRGSGIGLATVYGVVQSHGGAIEVRSNAPAGTTMRVVFPCARSETPPRGREVGAAPRVRAGAGVVMVVDDEPVVRDAAASALAGMGYEVVVARDGLEAVELYSARRGDVVAVVLDLVMPKLGGRDTFLALREVDPDVAVLVTTGYLMHEDAQQLVELGVKGFLAKPFGVETLSEAVARVTRG